MTDTKKIHEDYGTEHSFTIGNHQITKEQLFRNVIEYGSSLRSSIYRPTLNDLKNCQNDWFTFCLITKGVTSRWTIKTLQRYFGNDDVERFIEKRTKILSSVVKIGKDAEQYLNGSNTGKNE